MLVRVSKKAINGASAAFIWQKLSAFSDVASWHPEIETSKNVGSIPDASPNMVGAARRIKFRNDGDDLTETITAWSEKDRSLSYTLEGDVPPPVQRLEVTVTVCEDEKEGVFVDCVANVEIKWFFLFLYPILKLALPIKLGPVVAGMAEVKEE
jgi:Polyketide cyclase / dehydrase and lipid transport